MTACGLEGQRYPLHSTMVKLHHNEVNLSFETNCGHSFKNPVSSSFPQSPILQNLTHRFLSAQCSPCLKVYFSLLIYEQNAVGLWKTLYVCVTNINAKHRRPGMEELFVEKKRIVSLVMSSLQHPTNT